MTAIKCLLVSHLPTVVALVLALSGFEKAAEATAATAGAGMIGRSIAGNEPIDYFDVIFLLTCCLAGFLAWCLGFKKWVWAAVMKAFKREANTS